MSHIVLPSLGRKYYRNSDIIFFTFMNKHFLFPNSFSLYTTLCGILSSLYKIIDSKDIVKCTPNVYLRGTVHFVNVYKIDVNEQILFQCLLKLQKKHFDWIYQYGDNLISVL